MAKPDTTATKKSAVASTIENGVLTLTFAHGEVLTISPAMCSPEARDYAALHGLKQKLVDAAAIARNTDTGASATIADKFNAVKEVYDRITSPNGTWNKIRGGEGSGNGTGMLVRALMAVMGKTEAQITEILDGCTDDEVKALKNHPKVSAKMAEFRAAKSAIKVDDLLAKFE